MNRYQRDLTISVFVSSAIVIALTNVNGVDPVGLEAQLRGIEKARLLPELTSLRLVFSLL